MSELDKALSQTKSALATELSTGAWKPQPGDPLADCAFIRAGFRSWALEAPDQSWRLVLSRLDFGDSNPSALLTVYAPENDGAFGDLDWFAFSHSIGVNGGTNYNQCVKRLSSVLGASEVDWARRVTYLIGRARAANAGANNGTFSITGRPAPLASTPPFVFHDRIREGRTMSIFCPGSAGKTTIVDGLVASACSGKSIVPGWYPSRQYACLLLDWDEGREEEEVRLAAICAAYEADLVSAYHYKRMARPLYDVADEVGAYVVANGVEVVVVSPVGRAQRDHGDNQAAPVDELYEILRSFGTTNILIDHVTGDNMKGGAQREFGSVRKRDNARGSYSLYAQSEDIGQRVVVMKNTKPDAMSPKMPAQAVRIEYEPPEGRSGTYDSIRFIADEVVEGVGGYLTPDQEIGGPSIRQSVHRQLVLAHMTPEELADATGRNTPSIRTTLNRYRGTWFERLPSGKWEALPVPGGPRNSVT